MPPRRPRRPSPPGPRGRRRPAADATHWGDVASWYDGLVGDEGSDFHRHVVVPGVLAMLELPETDRAATRVRVLDLACGQGVLCRTLARRGVQVTGVDAAAALVDAAKQRNRADRLPIEYRVGDAAGLENLPGLHGRFDAVTCLLAIQNIAVLSPVWRGCRASLRPGGRLIVVMMHPCFRVPRASDWQWEPAADHPGGGAQHRRVEAYLSSRKTPIQMHPGSDPSATTLTFHRPMQAYINTLAESGLLIDRLEEWPSHRRSDRTDPKAPALDRARREIPMFLAVRARRVDLADG
jgi:SAM-dependent methyltransferase